MRSTAPTPAVLVACALVAVAARASAGSDAKPSPEPATSVATAWPSGPQRAPPPAAERPAPTVAPAPSRPAAVPSRTVTEKLGKGDRLALEGDHRGALFAYQDAVYMQPGYVPARVRLGRAYLALRYPVLAIAQAEAALASDPESGEARALLEEASAAAAGASAPALPARGPAGAAPPPGQRPAR